MVLSMDARRHMSKIKPSVFEAVLARMSLGAVPMDGFYWIDPKWARGRGGSAAAGAELSAAGTGAGQGDKTPVAIAEQSAVAAPLSTTGAQLLPGTRTGELS